MVSHPKVPELPTYSTPLVLLNPLSTLLAPLLAMFRAQMAGMLPPFIESHLASPPNLQSLPKQQVKLVTCDHLNQKEGLGLGTSMM